VRTPILKKIPDRSARAALEGGVVEECPRRPRFPPPNFVPVKLARR